MRHSDDNAHHSPVRSGRNQRICIMFPRYLKLKTEYTEDFVKQKRVVSPSAENKQDIAVYDKRRRTEETREEEGKQWTKF